MSWVTLEEIDAESSVVLVEEWTHANYTDFRVSVVVSRPRSSPVEVRRRFTWSRPFQEFINGAHAVLRVSHPRLFNSLREYCSREYPRREGDKSPLKPLVNISGSFDLDW